MKRRSRAMILPAVLIGRLAVDASLQGQGYGGKLLIDALRRIARAQEYAAAFVIVEPKDEGAARFYGAFGFFPLLGGDPRMALPVKTIARI